MSQTNPFFGKIKEVHDLNQTVVSIIESQVKSMTGSPVQKAMSQLLESTRNEVSMAKHYLDLVG